MAFQGEVARGRKSRRGDSAQRLRAPSRPLCAALVRVPRAPRGPRRATRRRAAPHLPRRRLRVDAPRGSLPFQRIRRSSRRSGGALAFRWSAAHTASHRAHGTSIPDALHTLAQHRRTTSQAPCRRRDGLGTDRRAPARAGRRSRNPGRCVSAWTIHARRLAQWGPTLRPGFTTPLTSSPQPSSLTARRRGRQGYGAAWPRERPGSGAQPPGLGREPTSRSPRRRRRCRIRAGPNR